MRGFLKKKIGVLFLLSFSLLMVFALVGCDKDDQGVVNDDSKVIEEDDSTVLETVDGDGGWHKVIADEYCSIIGVPTSDFDDNKMYKSGSEQIHILIEYCENEFEDYLFVSNTLKNATAEESDSRIQKQWAFGSGAPNPIEYWGEMDFSDISGDKSVVIDRLGKAIDPRFSLDVMSSFNGLEEVQMPSDAKYVFITDPTTGYSNFAYQGDPTNWDVIYLNVIFDDKGTPVSIGAFKRVFSE